VDQASAALITDLKQRGLLDETLVIWGGEFGRTNYCQGKIQVDNYGVTTIRGHFPFGWPEAESSQEWSMVRQMILDTTL
jgi:hypothetical protein